MKVNRAAGLFYIFVFAFVAIVFILILHKPVTAMFFESDMIWLAPSEMHIIASNSFIDAIRTYLFDVYQTKQLDPVTNIYYYLVMSYVGPQSKYLVSAALTLNLCIAILFLLIIYRSGLGIRASFFAAMAYFASFICFHAYMWSMTSHHLFVVFFTLLLYYMYLVTDGRSTSGMSWRTYFTATLLAAFISSFCAVTILILPAIIFCHIWFSNKDHEVRLRMYDRWIPLFVIYMGYPLIRFLYAGQGYIEKFLHLTPSISIINNNFLTYPAAFLAAVFLIFAARYIIKLQKYPVVRYAETFIFAGAALAIFAYLFGRQMTRDVSVSTLKRSFVSPYNLIAPFAASLDFFVSPLKNILTIPTTFAYHLIPLKSNIWSSLISVGLLAFFFKRIFFRYRDLVIFFVMYIIALRFLWSRPDCPSRHMIYASFIFSIVFVAAASSLYDRVMSKVKLRWLFREGIFALVFIFLCCANILAIRAELFRGRMANTFFNYDYIRDVYLIKADMSSSGKAGGAENIYIIDAPPDLMPKGCYDQACAADPNEHYNLRLAFVQAFDSSGMLKININRAPAPGALVYRIDKSELLGMDGLSIDPFFRLFEAGEKAFKEGRLEEARALLKKASEARPFFINYILGSYGLNDLAWITGGLPLNEWIGRLIANQIIGITGMDENEEGIPALIKRELRAYERCLALLSRSGLPREEPIANNSYGMFLLRLLYDYDIVA